MFCCWSDFNMEKCEMEGTVDEEECFREKGESLKGQRKKENGKMRERKTRPGAIYSAMVIDYQPW